MSSKYLGRRPSDLHGGMDLKFHTMSAEINSRTGSAWSQSSKLLDAHKHAHTLNGKGSRYRQFWRRTFSGDNDFMQSHLPSVVRFFHDAGTHYRSVLDFLVMTQSSNSERFNRLEALKIVKTSRQEQVLRLTYTRKP
jgi:cysteinyl-tRNA synthetase